MELALRLVGRSGANRQVLVEAIPGATIGDLAVGVAAALSDRVRPVYVGDERVDPRRGITDVPLRGGDTIGWGRAAPTAAAGALALEIVVVEGPDAGGRTSLTGTSVIGRGPAADVCVTDPTVSRQHAVLAPVEGGVELRHLGGRNPTRVAGEAVVTALLAPGDRFTVGRTTVEIVPRPAPPPAAVWGPDGSVELVVGHSPGLGPARLELGRSTGDVAIVGDREPSLALARALLVQLTAHPSSGGVALYVLAPDDPVPWQWTLWLPHTVASGGRRRVGSRPSDVSARVAEVRAELRRRLAGSSGGPVVVLVDGAAPELDDVRREGPAVGIYTITLDHHSPLRTATVLTVDRHRVRLGDASHVAVACRVDHADAEARGVLRRAPVPGHRVALADLLSAANATEAMASAWVERQALAVPIGIEADGTAVHVDLEGGHVAVLAGDPGERADVVRSMVAGLAAVQPPDRLRMVFLDGSGGLDGADRLPHGDWLSRRVDVAALAATRVRGDAAMVVVVEGVDALHLDDARFVRELSRLAGSGARLLVATDDTVDWPDDLAALFTTWVRVSASGATVAGAGRERTVAGLATVDAPRVGPGGEGAVPRVTVLDLVGAGSIRPRSPGDRRGLARIAAMATEAASVTGCEAADAASARPVRVLLVEDHAVLAEGMRAALLSAGCVVAAVADGCDTALEAMSAAALDVVIVDVDLASADASGAEVVGALRQVAPDVPLVLLSRHRRPPTPVLRRLLAYEPDAFLADGIEGSRLGDVVRAVVAGGQVFSPGVREHAAVRCAFDDMTAAERRVVVELARRPDTRARLARRLHLSISTVDSHLRAIKQKVTSELHDTGRLADDGVVSTEALIGWALEHGYDRADTSTFAPAT